MSTDSRDARLARRVADLYSTDAQFADGRPIEALTAAIEQPGLRLPRIMSTVMRAYAERPAVGERGVNLTTDPETGRIFLELLPWFQTVTYEELWERVGAVASALTHGPGHPVQPGDRVCVLGFASADYATIDMALAQLGAVSVPLQISAPVSQLRPIVTETEPRVFASSIGDLGDAVELVLTGHTPARLVVSDYRPEVNEQREAFDAARTRLAEAGSPVIVETLAELLERGKSLPAAPEFVPDDDDDPAKQKPITYVSPIGIGDQIEPSMFNEDADVRVISPARAINDSYANGYGNSKWAGEVLLREANDLCGLPVAVFRCDMILADTAYANQFNVPDMFTRLMLSLVSTGIAPGSFYELDADGSRQRAHYDGLPVGFIAEAISTLGEQVVEGFSTYHVMNPYDAGIGLDEYVDWLIDAGYPIQSIPGYDAWLHRFDTALRALPDKQRQTSLLPLLHNYQRPEKPIRGLMAPTDRFRAAVQEAKIGPDKDIPHVTAPVIVKYITDLQLLGLL